MGAATWAAPARPPGGPQWEGAIALSRFGANQIGARAKSSGMLGTG